MFLRVILLMHIAVLYPTSVLGSIILYEMPQAVSPVHCWQTSVASFINVLLWICLYTFPTVSLLEFLNIYPTVELLSYIGMHTFNSVLQCQIVFQSGYTNFSSFQKLMKFHCSTTLSALDIVRLWNSCQSSLYDMIFLVLICISAC